jgi:hypothetical protein
MLACMDTTEKALGPIQPLGFLLAGAYVSSSGSSSSSGVRI